MDIGGGIPLAGRRLEVLLLSLPVIFALYHLSMCAELTSLPLLGKTASQSSTSRERFSSTPLSADLAIDGDISTELSSLSCMQTHADSHSWWKVDLQATHCLGKVTLINLGDSRPELLTAAVVRAGVNADVFENAGCGSPVTPAEALVPGGELSFLCDPPVAASYVSVDIDLYRPGVVTVPGTGGVVLQLCEVMVEEYPMAKCQPMMSTEASTLASTMGNPSTAGYTPAYTIDNPGTAGYTPAHTMGNRRGGRGSCEFKLFWEGACVTEPRPLASIITQSLMPCTIKCKRDDRCWSFDYNSASGRCSLYDVQAKDLKTAPEPSCVVYAVVGFKVGATYNGVCKSSA